MTTLPAKTYAPGKAPPPSHRYDLFIKAFEKRVSAAQKEIEALREMERWYDACKDAMEKAKLPNEQDLHLGSSSIVISITAVPTDRITTFEKLAEDLGRRLVEKGLREKAEPAVRNSGSYRDWDFMWQVWKPSYRSAILTVKIPAEGLADVEVVCRKRMTESVEYELKRREPQQYVASGWQTAASDARKAALAADDPEVPF